ncbi:MAG TPA: protein kinase, partial [Polyangiaceae bacterium]|nr:protein kinase [Polyangiaceae bacterium]
LDFGISKLSADAQQGAHLELTQTRTSMGSPSYMSPEQLRSARSVDERADLWSLGVVLHELVTGALPFEADTLTELTARVISDEPTRPSSVRGGVSPELDRVVARCLSKDRDKRYRNVAELARDLEPLAGDVGTTSSVAARIERSSGLLRGTGGTDVAWGTTGNATPPAAAPRPRWAVGAGLALAVGLAVAVALPLRGVVTRARATPHTPTVAAPPSSPPPSPAPSALPLPEDRTHLPVLGPDAGAPATAPSAPPEASATALPTARGPQRPTAPRPKPSGAVAPGSAASAPARRAIDPNAMPEDRR